MDAKNKLSKKKRLQWFLLYHHDYCTICGKPLVFAPNSKSYYGLDKQGNYQHVCYSCQHNLSESYEWKEHRFEYDIPEENAVLWKYMDLAKLVSLFSTKSLYLRRLDKFDDKYEGAICSEKGEAHTQSNLSIAAQIEVLYQLKKELRKEISQEEFIRLTKDKLKKMEEDREHLRSSKFVTCWSCNNVESEAMWRLYAKDMQCGVAIKTTYEKLFFALDKAYDVEIGKVHYNDFGTTDYVGRYPEWYKRISLEYENEVRVVLRKDSNTYTDWGICIPVDINALIQEIVISPEAGTWFLNVVQDLCAKYNVLSPVKTSEIQIQPYY